MNEVKKRFDTDINDLRFFLSNIKFLLKTKQLVISMKNTSDVIYLLQ